MPNIFEIRPSLFNREDLDHPKIAVDNNLYTLYGDWILTPISETNTGKEGKADPNGLFSAILFKSDQQLVIQRSNHVIYCGTKEQFGLGLMGDPYTEGWDTVAYLPPLYLLKPEAQERFKKRIMRKTVWENMQMYLYRNGMLGTFNAGLWDAIFNADRRNLEKLALGFPEEVQCLKAYKGLE
jgi:hypothetical protein